ncbi:hypothetical protein GCM10011574_52910 [Microbispora bryophytorum]|uniref:Uncharacterized protein n=1 Tax=Microbispora bryophytorum TaxID=1460882 RepID=A0A8H9LC73_9ACTN|nr:hypothetical protein GCM10011574_52910 [Microbispora bryophytorum]
MPRKQRRWAADAAHLDPVMPPAAEPYYRARSPAIYARIRARKRACSTKWADGRVANVQSSPGPFRRRRRIPRIG